MVLSTFRVGLLYLVNPLTGTPRGVLYLLPKCFSPSQVDGPDDHHRESRFTCFPFLEIALLETSACISQAKVSGILHWCPFCYERDNSPAPEVAFFLYLDVTYLTRVQVSNSL